MKKILVMMLVAVMCLVFVACNSTESTKTEHVDTEPVKTVDPVEKAKEKLTSAYDECCPGYDKDDYASLGYDNMSLTIDTNPYDRSYSAYEDEAFEAIVSINSYLGIPSSVLDKMSSTRALDGMQSQNCGTYTVTWNYHPDNGMKVIYEVNP